MALDQETELSTAETDALLGRHETGVLSLAREDEPYSVPISYGYDADERRFYLRLVSSPESDKRRFLSSAPRAQLVVYEEEGDTVSVDRSKLTPRQREVLETAHEMGYFEHPRHANATEVAAALDISPSTFGEHLTAAQAKLFDDIL